MSVAGWMARPILSKEGIVDFLMAFVEDQSVASIVEEKIFIRSLKLAADDLRHYYYQAAMAKPGIVGRRIGRLVLW